MNDSRRISLHDAVKGKVIYILVLVTVLQIVYPLTLSESVIPLLLYQSCYALLIIVGILVARESPRLTAFLIVLGIIWVIVGAIYAFRQSAIWALILAYISIAAYQSSIIYVLMQYIFKERSVTRDVIYAAISVYVLLGAVFVPIYGFIETTTFTQTGMHAFADSLVPAREVFPWQNFIYYSYATLTTLGYGDILPISMWARSIAAVEAVIGVLYVTIIMARLVSLYTAEQVE